MILAVASCMMKYTSYSSGGASEVFDKIPFSLKALLGIGSYDVTKASGFFAFIFLYLELTVAIHAVLLGAGIISKEERDKTTEFLMIKPVSRQTILTAKLSAALVNIVVVNIVTLVSSIAIVGSYNKGKDATPEIVMFMISMFVVQLVFLSLGAAIAAIVKNPKSAGSLGTGMMIIAFVISEITNLTDKINFINVLSPFKYFSYYDLVAGKGINIIILLLSLLLVALFTASTYFFYQKRDLYV